MCLAIPGKIISIVDDDNLGLHRGIADFSGIRKEVSLDYTPWAPEGDYVLVHVGFALIVLDETEAYRVFDSLRELDQVEELKESPTP
jgi:hydrogenase expression/formation protein HypC